MRTEFPQLHSKVYADHAGATLYTKSQIEAFKQVTLHFFKAALDAAVDENAAVVLAALYQMHTYHMHIRSDPWNLQDLGFIWQCTLYVIPLVLY